MSKKILQAAAGAAGGESIYVDDVFSTYLYDGTGSTQSINNGLDLDGEGGLVWIKNRDQSDFHILVDTERGTGNRLSTNSTGGINLDTDTVTAFNSNGFTIGADVKVNTNTESYVSWTFEKAAGFFDCVSWTGDGTSGRSISHNLGSTPGFIIIKRTNSSSNWLCYHRSLGIGQRIVLQSTAAAASDTNISAVSDSSFTVGNGVLVNNSGDTYVAYVFAHDDQSFGDDSDEAIIKCGSYTGATSGTNVINVGFEPQWVMIKGTDRVCDWVIFDNMRPWPTDGTTSFLRANTSAAEASNFGNKLNITSTGFSIPSTSTGNVNEYNEGYIYIAIRRPMKTPEAATEVFDIAITEAASSVDFVTSPEFPIDFMWTKTTDYSGYFPYGLVRLLGQTYHEMGRVFNEQSTSAISFDYQNKIVSTGLGGVNSTVTGDTKENTSYLFKRATGFFDVVAYTGNGTAGTTYSHNLGVVPEFMIVRSRNLSENLATYHVGMNGGTTPQNYNMVLSATTAEGADSDIWNNTAPTSSVFTVGGNDKVNGSADTYVAFLFATLAGVSKVGSYSGTGSNINVDCGFSSGARMILIKRTDSTGSWYFWDSENGIVAGNDPYWINNSSAASVTTTDYIDPLSSGFTVTSSAPADINTSGGTYIFLAIA